jgi:uncharacterized membrane protein (UPF0127 family)
VSTTSAAPQWLVRNAAVLAAVEVPTGAHGRARGLLGRDGIDGVMLLRPCRNVHTFRMRFAIDVAFCDRDDVVLRTTRLPPGRISPIVWRAAYVLEAEAGAFARWELRARDRAGTRAETETGA